MKKTSTLFPTYTKFLKEHKKAFIIPVIILLYVSSMFAYGKYKDYQNAEFMKGLANDFPAVVTEIEQATGLTLEVQSNCMITQEKFGNGVRTCEMVATNKTNNINMETAREILRGDDSVFKETKAYQNNLGYDYQYKGLNSCGLGLNARGDGILSITCITAVREANVELAKELFQ